MYFLIAGAKHLLLMDNDMLRLYQIVQELSEQLAHNQKFAASLQAQTASLKVCACVRACARIH